MSKLRTLRQGGFGLACAADIVLARQMRSDGAEGVAAFRDKRDAAWVEKLERLPGSAT